MLLSIPQGTTSKDIPFSVYDSSSTTGAKLAGLVYNSGSLTAYYSRQGVTGAAVAISLATKTKGTWATSGFVAIDGTNMPGDYELGIPDAALAAGATWVKVQLKGATNMVPVDIMIELTATSNQDAVGGGMSRLDAAVTSRMATYTQPTGFLAATFPSGTIANTTNLTAGTVATVTNQLTAAQIATGVWQDAVAGDFTTASSIGKSLYTSGVVPGGTNGLFIAGTNAATTVTTSFTTTFTGNLTGTTGAAASVTGNVNGNVGGSVASVTAPVTITSNIKQNQALANFEFLMTDSTNHNPSTGLTVTVTRSIDGGAFAAGTLSAVTEVGNGIYAVSFGAGDLNGKTIVLQATATASDTTFERIITQV